MVPVDEFPKDHEDESKDSMSESENTDSTNLEPAEYSKQNLRDRIVERSSRSYGTSSSPISSGGGGGGCFIATAAYGTSFQNRMLVLYRFRDEYLLRNSLGKVVVSLYYRVSPPISNVIKRHASLRFLTRCLLNPIVFALKCILKKKH